MASTEQYTGRQFPYVMLSSAGTAGDLMYLDTGSAAPLKSATTGTDNTSAFLGVLVGDTVAGSYGGIITEGVIDLEKLASTNKIEAGNIIYADGAAADNLVGTVAGGTAIGICVKQSASTDTYVRTKILPFYVTGAGGFYSA